MWKLHLFSPTLCAHYDAVMARALALLAIASQQPLLGSRHPVHRSQLEQTLCLSSLRTITECRLVTVTIGITVPMAIAITIAVTVAIAVAMSGTIAITVILAFTIPIDVTVPFTVSINVAIPVQCCHY